MCTNFTAGHKIQLFVLSFMIQSNTTIKFKQGFLMFLTEDSVLSVTQLKTVPPNKQRDSAVTESNGNVPFEPIFHFLNLTCHSDTEIRTCHWPIQAVHEEVTKKWGTYLRTYLIFTTAITFPYRSELHAYRLIYIRVFVVSQLIFVKDTTSLKFTLFLPSG
jgi:hypothetical protein